MGLSCSLQVHQGLQPIKSIWRDGLDLAVFDEPGKSILKRKLKYYKC